MSERVLQLYGYNVALILSDKGGAFEVHGAIAKGHDVNHHEIAKIDMNRVLEAISERNANLQPLYRNVKVIDA